jgi:hypothetical protein
LTHVRSIFPLPWRGCPRTCSGGRERRGGHNKTRLHPNSPTRGQWKKRSKIAAQGGCTKEDGEECSAPAPSLLQQINDRKTGIWPEARDRNAAVCASDSLSQSQGRSSSDLLWMLCVVPREGRSTPGSSPKLPEHLGASPRYCRRCTWFWQFRLARDTDPLRSKTIGKEFRTYIELCQGVFSEITKEQSAELLFALSNLMTIDVKMSIPVNYSNGQKYREYQGSIRSYNSNYVASLMTEVCRVGAQ